MPDSRELLDTRLKIWRSFIVLSLIFLLGGLYYFQIEHNDKYVQLASNNRLRLIRFPPARGEIFDRNGVSLAVNETTFNIMGYPLDLQNSDVLSRIAKLLSKQGILTSPQQLNALLKKQRPAPYRVMTITTNLAMTQMAEIVSDPEFPPQLFPIPVWRRIYPAGALTSNITGYVGEISEAELKQKKEDGYLMGDIVGKSGVEKTYEHILRGVAGQEAIEVDARGRRVRSIGTSNTVRGKDITLTLDLGAQRLAHEILESGGHRGAVVVLDVQTGGVVVLASSPTYDNNPLAWGISQQEWKALITNPDKPMLNRAISGTYPPASTFKALMGIALLAEGVVTPRSTFYCAGAMSLGEHTFRCWRRSGHGTVNITQALQYSCDVFFYQAGLKLGIERILKWMNKFGFGEITGIDIPGESSGTIAGPEWKQARLKQSWYPGDTVNYSIGQGFLLTTPLQLARFYATVANGGHLVHPHLVTSSYKKPTDLKISSNVLSIVQNGLETVVKHGTGSSAGRFGIEIAGKTGTAQNSHGPDHALFVGYAPANEPKYAAAVVLEAGIAGGSVAAPICGEILAFLLNR